MKIEFSKHALDQLKERPRITWEMVVGTIENPNETLESYKGRRLFRKAFQNEVLEVVTIEESGKIIVITEYLLEKL